ncbi:hypothetical protein BT69DRAFT_501557 [Atractiella rhizophila]|nr:hypothetical protein BT69DRAFT_501557 [Atractiella rhizophila]
MGFSYCPTASLTNVAPEDALLSGRIDSSQSHVHSSPGSRTDRSDRFPYRQSEESLSMRSLRGEESEFELEGEGMDQSEVVNKAYSITSIRSHSKDKDRPKTPKSAPSSRHIAFKDAVEFSTNAVFLGRVPPEATRRGRGGGVDARPGRRSSILGTGTASSSGQASTSNANAGGSGSINNGGNKDREKEREKEKKKFKQKAKAKVGKIKVSVGLMNERQRKDILDSLRLTHVCKGHILNEALPLSATTVPNDLLALHFRHIHPHLPIRTYYEPHARLCCWYLKPGLITPKMIFSHTASTPMGIKEPKGAWKRVWINIKGRLLSVLKDHKMCRTNK